MKYAIPLVAAPAAIIASLFFGRPTALANPTDIGIGHNPGLQVSCAFNPAFRAAHSAACAGVTVEYVASNGGAPEPEEPPAREQTKP